MRFLVLGIAEEAVREGMFSKTGIGIVSLQWADFMREHDGPFSWIVAILLADVDDTLRIRGVFSASLTTRNKLNWVPQDRWYATWPGSN